MQAGATVVDVGGTVVVVGATVVVVGATVVVVGATVVVAPQAPEATEAVAPLLLVQELGSVQVKSMQLISVNDTFHGAHGLLPNTSYQNFAHPHPPPLPIRCICHRKFIHSNETLHPPLLNHMHPICHVIVWSPLHPAKSPDRPDKVTHI